MPRGEQGRSSVMPIRGPHAPLGDGLLQAGTFCRRLFDDRLFLHRRRLRSRSLSLGLGGWFFLQLRRWLFLRLLLQLHGLLALLLAILPNLTDPCGDEELD